MAQTPPTPEPQPPPPPPQPATTQPRRPHRPKRTKTDCCVARIIAGIKTACTSFNPNANKALVFDTINKAARPHQHSYAGFLRSYTYGRAQAWVTVLDAAVDDTHFSIHQPLNHRLLWDVVHEMHEAAMSDNCDVVFALVSLVWDSNLRDATRKGPRPTRPASTSISFSKQCRCSAPTGQPASASAFASDANADVDDETENAWAMALAEALLAEDPEDVDGVPNDDQDPYHRPHHPDHDDQGYDSSDNSDNGGGVALVGPACFQDVQEMEEAGMAEADGLLRSTACSSNALQGTIAQAKPALR